MQGMPILGFFDESLATMQRKFILYHENILGCQRNNPRGNVLPSLRSGGLFYPRCARVKQLPPFSSIGKNNFPPLVFLRLPKFFHNTRTSIPRHLLQFHTFHEPLHAITSRECKVRTYWPSNKVFHSCSNLQHSDRPNKDYKRFHTCLKE